MGEDGRSKVDQENRAAQLVARARKLLDHWDDESEIDRAQSLFRQATALAPKNAEAWRGLADTLEEMEEYAESIDAYQRAIQLGLDDEKLWARLGVAASWVPGHEGEGIEAMERARALAPNNMHVLDQYVGVLTRLGTRLERHDLIAKALEAARHEVALVPHEPLTAQAGWALQSLGALLIGEGRYHEALDAFDHLLSAVDSAPKNAWFADQYLKAAWYGRALALDRLGQTTEALSSVEHGLRLNEDELDDPELADVEEQLWRAFHAELLLRVDQRDLAQAEIEAVLTYASEFAYPWRVLAQVHEAARRTEQARVANEHASQHPEQPTLLDFLLPGKV